MLRGPLAFFMYINYTKPNDSTGNLVMDGDSHRVTEVLFSLLGVLMEMGVRKDLCDGWSLVQQVPEKLIQSRGLLGGCRSVSGVEPAQSQRY